MRELGCKAVVVVVVVLRNLLICYGAEMLYKGVTGGGIMTLNKCGLFAGWNGNP